MKVVALIYKYYHFKKLPQPYFRSVMTITGFFIMIFLLFFTIFPIPYSYNPFWVNANSIMNYIYGGVFVGLLYFIVAFIFKRKKLDQYSFTEEQLKRCGRYIVAIFFFLLFLLLITTVLHLRDKW